MKKEFEIWAHRGLHNELIPENSLEAIQAAIDEDVYGIETDVWLHNNQLVLTHKQPTKKHPLLKDALKIIDGKSQIYLELKHEPSAAKTIELVNDIYREHFGSVIFASFDQKTLRQVRKFAPNARLALNYRGIDNYFIDLVEELDIEYLGLNWKGALPNYFNIKQAKSLTNTKILAYTVNFEFIYHLMKFLGLNGIFTDNQNFLEQNETI